MILLIIICATLSFSVAYIYQAETAKDKFNQNSAYKVSQIAQKINENKDLILTMENDLKKEYLVKARSVSLFLENDRNIIYNQEILKNYMDLLSFDEIHFFDETGTIFAGTHPEYYGFSFESGEQMAFFAPLLDDRNLELAQDVAPNTAEEKLVQYVAVWNESKDMIVQIGHEPKHLIKALESTELSYLLPLMIDDADTTFIVYDNDTLEIVTATETEYIGKRIDTIDYSIVSNDVVKVDGVRIYNYSSVIDDITLVMNIAESVLYDGVLASASVTTLIVVLITLTLMIVIIVLLNSIIINPIIMLIKEMEKIGKGNLNIELDIKETPEFKSLSHSINQMIKNLLEYDIHTTKLFQSITIPIAMFEYSNEQNEVKATGKLAEILPVSLDEAYEILRDQRLFANIIREMQTNKLDGEDDIFIIEDGIKSRLLKIQIYKEDNKEWGFIVDMTSELQNQEQIRRERDTDLLTGLSSRRCFLEKMQALLDSDEDFGVLAVVMLDLDNLKYVNDTFGHESGDTLILTAANLIKGYSCRKKILARIGGDEFVIVSYGSETKDEIRASLDLFQKAVSETSITVTDGKSVPVSISVGYTFYGDYGTNQGDLLRAADEAMYKVKRTKKGSIAEYSPESISL